jgi:hypothetical protein
MEEEKKKEKIRYNKELLDKVLERDGATLVGSYDKLNRTTLINYICNCGKENEKVFRYCNENSGCFCIDCSKDNIKLKSTKTNIENFGVSNIKKLNPIYTLEKLHTCIIRDNAILNETYNEMSACVKINFKCICGKNTIKTCKNIINYGGAYCNICYRKGKREKTQRTNNEKYGTNTPAENDKVKEKMRNTTKERYGVEYTLQIKEVRNKIKKTNLERYGVENPAQNLEIFEKQQKNSYNFKGFIMPSGEIRKVQGYEPFAITYLLKKYTEDKIKTDRKDVGRIQYEINGEKRYYFPDIYIPDENKFIEVKSEYTAKQNPELIEKKKQACIDQGYECEIWVFNKKGEKIEK